jgi:hypothetical protein
VVRKDGREWLHTADNRNHLFITFKTDDPIRQILADVTWPLGEMGQRIERPGLPKIPHAIIRTPGICKEVSDEASKYVANFLSWYDEGSEIAGACLSGVPNKIFGRARLHFRRNR